MKIPIQRIRNSKKIETDTEIKNAELGDEAKLMGPIKLTGTLKYTGNEEIYFEGKLHAKVQLTCVNCLKKFVQEFIIDFSESYVPQYFVDSQQRKEERNLEELDVFTYKGNSIDLDKIARDLLLEHIPPYPLCPECRAKI